MKKAKNGIGNRKIATYEEWLNARRELLKAEKELTRNSDEVAELRLQLPCVPVNKEYIFDTDQGKLTFRQLFKNRS
ncbi:DUF899 family protein [Olivibacter sp. SDN3]|uniref:DUF899 family protein n=1 Tax=Olivibacter sp. SDN3 TaxID=2764720 RepID=UPI001650E00D|nr:DUF899 family protein [Olivibacter sp. SDN3]QNL47856.1 DUF899 family protein [Olivibacter sp. SDN3]